MNEWISLLQTFGLGVCILIFVGLCIWKAAPWCAERVIVPVVDRIIKLLDALIVSVIKQAETMEKIGTAMAKLGDTMERQSCRAMEMLKEMENLRGQERCHDEDMGSGR